MAPKVFLFLHCVLFYSCINSQKVIDKTSLALLNTVDRFLQKSDRYDPARKDARKQEIILMVLEIDSNGSVSNIHLLGDRNNIDSTYSILQRMKPQDFTAKEFVRWKNKILNLPVYSLIGIEVDSAGKPTVSYVEKSIIHHSDPFESRTSVMLRPLYYLIPGLQVSRDKTINFSP